MIYDSTYVHVGGTRYSEGATSCANDSTSKLSGVSKIVYLPKAKTDEMLNGLKMYNTKSRLDLVKIITNAVYDKIKGKILEKAGVKTVETIVEEGIEYMVPGFSQISSLADALELAGDIVNCSDDVNKLSRLYTEIKTNQSKSPQKCVKIYYNNYGNYYVEPWDYRSIDSSIKGNKCEYYTSFHQGYFENEIDKILKLSALQ